MDNPLRAGISVALALWAAASLPLQAAEPVTVLSDDDSWDLISGVHLGRLVTVLESRAEIFPVNFVVQRHTILLRSAEGTKLFTTVMNDQVLFEADDHNVSEGWSVIVRGSAEVLFAADDIQEAEQAGRDDGDP